jgi:hypothetical protein
MKIKELKIANITLLFSSPLNHQQISQTEVVKLFATGNPQMDLLNFVEAPGLKLLILPNQKKEIAFEATRLAINDKSEAEIRKSALVDDFTKVFNSSAVNKSAVIAYGFNFDVLAEMETGNMNDLIGPKVSKLPNIISADINVVFEKDSIRHSLKITPAGMEKIFLVHFNAHIAVNTVPDNDELNKQMVFQFNKFENIIKDI